MNIFQEVKKLDLPIGEYVVVGSGPMAAREIRAFKDIDILVSEKLYDELVKKGWEVVEVEGVGGKFKVLKKDIFEINTTLWHGDYKPDNKNLIEQAEIICDVPFLQLKELIKFKTALAREKDLKDIELINNYLQKISDKDEKD
jgi:hypothetical protein